MKKIFTIAIIFLLFFTIIKSQPVLMGIAVRNFGRYKVGDSIRLDGYRYNSYNQTEVYILKSYSGEAYILVSWIKLLDDSIGFWTKVWFQNRAIAICNNGWQSSNRNILYEDFVNYMTSIEKHNLILRDDYLDEYFRDLIEVIQPECLIRSDERYVEIIILKSSEPEIYAFNHGAIVMTTGKIAEIECEEDLALLLAEQIAHIVLEDNLANLNKYERRKDAVGIVGMIFSIGSNVAMGIHNVRNEDNFTAGDMLSVWDMSFSLPDKLVHPPVDLYTPQQIKRTQKIARRWFDDPSKENISFHTPKEYGMIMLPVIKDLEWENYFLGNYDVSLQLINRLISLGIGDEEDYLLKTKIYLVRFDDQESNLQALGFIEIAEQMDQYNYVELSMQKGIILMRLERYEEAKTAFLEYISSAEAYGEDPEQINEAKKMLDRCNVLLNNP